MHLILLLGTNPLPVFVSAKYLVRHFKKKNNSITRVTLIHGNHEKVAGFARWLKDSIKVLIDKRAEVDTKSVFPDNPKDIEDKLKEAAPDDNEPVHLHYTGGTKEMAVEAVRWMYRDTASGTPGLPAGWSCSYLSGRTHKLIWKGMQRPDESKDLRRESVCDVSIRQLIEMHCVPGEIQAPLFAGISFGEQGPRVTSELFEEDTLNAIGSMYPQRELFRVAFNKIAEDDRGKNEVLSIADVCRQLSALGETDILESFSCIGRPLQNQGIPISRGTWLELITAWAIVDALTKLEIRASVVMGLKMVAARRNTGQDLVDMMERDVVVLAGHQLLVIECKSGKPEKAAVFETYHRARQLGGDAARAIVLFATEPDGRESATSEDLNREVAIHIGDDPPGVRVWGKNELDNLNDCMSRYLCELFS